MADSNNLEQLRHHFLKTTTHDTEVLVQQKCAIFSRAYLENADEKMSAKRWYIAFRLYNEALAYAPTREELGLIYSKRAETLMCMGHFKFAQDTINLARSHTSSDELLEKLERQERKCRRESDKRGEPEEAAPNIRLSYESQPGTCFIQGLKLQTDETYGRHVITEHQLQPGDVIAIEEEYVHVDYRVCLQCHNEVWYSSVPCPYCTSVMFCSEACLKKNWASLHGIECPLIPYIRKIEPRTTPNCMLALRLLTKALQLFPNVIQLKKFLAGSKKKADYNSTLCFVANKTERQKFLALYNMNTNEEHLTPEEMEESLEKTGYVCRLLKTLTPLREQMKTTNAENIILSLFHRLLLIARGQKPFKIYLLGGMFNHSCIPNVELVERDAVAVYVVTQPVGPDEQLFIHYGMNYLNTELSKRQENLWQRFKFRCDCDACENCYETEPNPSVSLIHMTECLVKDKSWDQVRLQVVDAWDRYGHKFPCPEIKWATFKMLTKMFHMPE